MNKSLVFAHSEATKHVNPSGHALMTTVECNRTTKKSERKRGNGGRSGKTVTL